MAHLRGIDGGGENARNEAIDAVIRNEIEPLIELIQEAARDRDIEKMRTRSLMLVTSVNRLLEDGS